jgi:hypothetical protein
MSPDLPDDLRALLDLARDYLRTHEDVRRGVAVVGRALAALAEWSAPSTEAVPPTEPVAQPEPAEPVAPPREPAVPISSLPPLTFAPPPLSPTHHPYPTGNGEISPQPLATIAARCRLKAEACRLTARRVGGSDEREAYAALIRQAGELHDCYLWMLDGSVSAEPAAVWNDLAGAFEAGADAAEMLRVWWELPDAHRGRSAGEVLHLAAEAQAVLFAAVAGVRRAKPDVDQIHLFVTIREEAARLHVFITRYLKREDRADPAGGPGVTRRVRELVAPMRQVADLGKNRHKVIGNLKHKTRRLKDDPAGNADEWPRVAQLLDELVAGGLPPSNAEVRDILLPVFDLFPDELPLSPGAERVLREVDRFIATRPGEEESRVEEAPSAEVAEVRRLLAGRQVVLIGGQLRPASRAALVEAFGLDDLQWVTTVDHESVSVFEAPIARPEVAVVLLAIRWSSHSYGDVREFCDRFGKLLVRLPGGYNPNQVAHQILTQVGHRLRAAG